MDVVGLKGKERNMKKKKFTTKCSFSKLPSTDLHAALLMLVAAFLLLFLVGKSGVVGGSQGVVTS